jgi:hypothetical protein
MKNILALLAFAFFAVGTTQAQNAPDISYVGGNNGAISYTYQGVYSETAPASAAAQDVTLDITGYSHVNLLDASSKSATIAPGGTGNNFARIDGDLRYATNFADATVSATVTELGVPAGTENFDEMYFDVATRLWGSNQVTVEDMGDNGSTGTFNFLRWRGGDANSGDVKTFVENFGEVVAIVPIRYDIVVSDVALEGQRQFEVEFTIAP